MISYPGTAMLCNFEGSAKCQVKGGDSLTLSFSYNYNLATQYASPTVLFLFRFFQMTNDIHIHGKLKN